MLQNVAFFNKKGKIHLIINIVSGERGDLVLCPNVFVWDCLKEEFKECHTTLCNKGWRKGGKEELYRLVGTATCKECY